MAPYFKLIQVCILSAAIAGCNCAPVSREVVESHAPKSRLGFTLLSWRASNGTSRYVLMSHDAADLFLGGFDRSKTPRENAKRFRHRVESLGTLKDTLLTLPAGAPILWHDDLSLGLKHASSREMDDLCSFAEVHHLQFYGCY
jgi:hypothetical protein